jgi:RNA polymerase sigma factor (sigma-70 family)
MLDLKSDFDVLRESAEHPELFTVIYDRHFDAIHRYLRRRLGADLGEDMAAEVFLRGFRARSAVKAQYESVLPWLFGIASKLVVDHRRAEQRRLRQLQRLAQDVELIADRDPDGFRLEPSLAAGLLRLKPHDREALLLVAWGELSYDEVAQLLDVPIGTVRSRIARARRLLAHGANPPASGRHRRELHVEA